MEGSSNESVATIKSIDCVAGQRKYPSHRQTATMQVKHRTGGPKEYLLAFQPDLDKLIPNTMVRIYWVAKSDESATKTAVALRIEPIAQVEYLDQK